MSGKISPNKYLTSLINVNYFLGKIIFKSFFFPIFFIFQIKLYSIDFLFMNIMDFHILEDLVYKFPTKFDEIFTNL